MQVNNNLLKIADLIDLYCLRIANIQGQERGSVGSPALLLGPGLPLPPPLLTDSIPEDTPPGPQQVTRRRTVTTWSSQVFLKDSPSKTAKAGSFEGCRPRTETQPMRV